MLCGFPQNIFLVCHKLHGMVHHTVLLKTSSSSMLGFNFDSALIKCFTQIQLYWTITVFIYSKVTHMFIITAVIWSLVRLIQMSVLMWNKSMVSLMHKNEHKVLDMFILCNLLLCHAFFPFHWMFLIFLVLPISSSWLSFHSLGSRSGHSFLSNSVSIATLIILLYCMSGIQYL